ncbi:MAG: single-stranded DNA-binding protein [Nitrobacter sp.]|uniref:single-stranded DNA-binding protein n=1 Tax=Nitrobacter sp. TaxID=29420 RepID=UPI00262AA107|nr:single-stranded DNA-binding protein [Nitrobacter sp.]MCV0387890.1 single-stranded DNA-binding protein [Nitrobacter sp.]
MNINAIHVCGNLTRDPELKALASGGSIATFGIATNRAVKKPDGSKGEETEYHSIVVFGKLAETCAQYLRKGGTAYVQGRVQTRSWDSPENGKQYRAEIVAEKVQFGPRLPKGDVAPEADVDQRPPSERSPKEPTTSDTGYPDEGIDISAIPF